jgi:hypothetical protein
MECFSLSYRYYNEKTIMDDTIAIRNIMDVARYIDGCLGVIFNKLFDVRIEIEKNP